MSSLDSRERSLICYPHNLYDAGPMVTLTGFGRQTLVSLFEKSNGEKTPSDSFERQAGTDVKLLV